MSLLPSINAWHDDKKGHYDYFFALATEAASQWSKYPAISSINAANNSILSTNSIAISSQTLTADDHAVYANGEPLATVSSLTSSVTNWASFPATGNVNFQNFEILSTSSIQLDGVFLSATPDELLINGIPVLVSTMFNTSSIAEWSYYDAISTVWMGNNLIQDCIGIELNNNQVTTGGMNTIQVNGQNPVAVWSGYAATGNVNMNFNSIASANTVSATSITSQSNTSLSLNTNNARVNTSLISLGNDIMKNVNISTLFTSTLTAPVVYSASTFARNLILSNATNSNVLTTTGATLFYNGVTVNTGASGNVAQWSQFPGVSLITNNRGYGGDALEMLGKSYFNGDVQMRSFTGGSPNVAFDRSSAGGPYFNIDDTNFNARGPRNQIGQSNLLPYQSQNFILGQTFIDGGTVRTISIGCLPTPVGPPINTQRIDVTPAGILLTTPTFITMNGLGAANIAMGGAIALASGSAVTLEHGFGLGQNGIFIQDTARNDQARLTLEFGGAVGPSVDNPGNAAKVDYHGTNLYIQTITNTFNGNRWPRTRDVFIDSVSTLKFVNGVQYIASNNSTINTRGSFTTDIINTSTLNTNNVSTVNLYVESMFSLYTNGQINVYDTLAGSKAIYAQTILGAPTVRASTIYGTSGASVDGQLFLQTPLVTATNNLRVTNTLYSEDARVQGQMTVSTIQAFVGEPVTFANSVTNIPNSATISTLTVQTVNGYPYPLLNQSGYMTTSFVQTITTTFTLYDSLTETFTANTTGYCTATGILTTISNNASNWYVNIQIEVNGVLSGNVDSFSNTGNGHQTQVTTIWRFPTVEGTTYTIALFVNGSTGVVADAERGTLSFISGLN